MLLLMYLFGLIQVLCDLFCVLHLICLSFFFPSVYICDGKLTQDLIEKLLKIIFTVMKQKMLNDFLQKNLSAESFLTK